MNINATLFAQVIVFLILAWVTMKFVWPPMIQTIDARIHRISDGLAAADKGKITLEHARQEATQIIAHAHSEGKQRIKDAEQAAQKASKLIKQEAQQQADRIIESAQTEIAQQMQKTRDQLHNELAALVIKGAEQILKREINPEIHADLLNRLSLNHRENP